MFRAVAILALGLAIVGCSRSAPEVPQTEPIHSSDSADDGSDLPEMDPATAAAQDKAIKFVEGMKGKVKRADKQPGKPVTEVDLIFKPITDAELKELAPLTNLTVLNLGYTQVTDAGLKELAVFKNLTTLSLRGTKITGIGFRSLAPLKNFTSLDLCATHVSDGGLREIARLKNLTTLDIKAIMGTPDGVKDLQRALPKCKIDKIQ
jgi:hypothetical protein